MSKKFDILLRRQVVKFGRCWPRCAKLFGDDAVDPAPITSVEKIHIGFPILRNGERRFNMLSVHIDDVKKTVRPNGEAGRSKPWVSGSQKLPAFLAFVALSYKSRLFIKGDKY